MSLLLLLGRAAAIPDISGIRDEAVFTMPVFGDSVETIGVVIDSTAALNMDSIQDSATFVMPAFGTPVETVSVTLNAI